MKTIATLLSLLMCGAALASGGADLRLDPAPIHRLDAESLQRGARNFVNYCLNCHSAKYMRYERLKDIGLTEQQIKDNLMFGTDKIGSTMTVAMTPPKARHGSAQCRPTCPSRRACAARLALQLPAWVLSRRLDADRLEQPRVPERRPCRTCCGR
jgi:cytochrome c1